MSGEERGIVGEVHVDPDAPGVFLRGNNVYVYPVDEDGNHAEPPTDPAVPLGEGWTHVGYTTDGIGPSEVDLAPLNGPAHFAEHFLGVETVWSAQRLLMDSLFGVAEDRPTHSLTVRFTDVEPPVAAPRKARGLTGKRYRIARRHYGRVMRAWRRGLIPGREVQRELHMPAVTTDVQPVLGHPGEFSVGFRPVSH